MQGGNAMLDWWSGRARKRQDERQSLTVRGSSGTRTVRGLRKAPEPSRANTKSGRE